MCSNLLERGFFDEALKTGNAPRVGKTIESALSYCQKLLQPGGTCESLLPSTYSVWKKASGIECGSPSYTKFEYTNPGNDQTKSLLHVDYAMVGEYALAQQFWFRVYKGIILFLWFCVIFLEYREILKILAVVLYVPDSKEFGDNAVIMEQDPADPEDVRFRIQGIESKHRMNIAILTVVRSLLTIALAIIGASYIIRTNSYSGLLMNGVTLAFVAELAALLYGQVLREEIRDQCEDIKPMKVKMLGIDWLNRHPALSDIFHITVVMVIVYAVMEWQLASVVLPVHDSLNCTCGQMGDNCVEAQTFNHGFWNHYWGTAVPGVFEDVAKMKSATGAFMFAESFAKPSLNETIANHDLELQAQQLMVTHESLASQVEKLQEKYEARLISKSKTPVGRSSLPQPPKFEMTGVISSSLLQRKKSSVKFAL